MATNNRPLKGMGLVDFPIEYVAIDLETTGTSPRWDRIIAIGAIRYRDGEKVDSFQRLVNPGFEIDNFIVGLTGITNEMLADAPDEESVMTELSAFLDADEIVVGHNIASFDSNFLYDAAERSLGVPLTNDYVDTMRLARRLHPEWGHHRLSDLREYYGITDEGAHRSIADVEATASAFEHLRDEAVSRFGTIEDFRVFMSKRKKVPSKSSSVAGSSGFDDIKPTVDEWDEAHPFCGKEVAVTGKVSDDWSQRDVAQAVVNHGGFFAPKFKKKTTSFLIVGDYSACRQLGGKPSAKHRTALEMQAQGKDITILDADAFFDLVCD